MTQVPVDGFYKAKIEGIWEVVQVDGGSIFRAGMADIYSIDDVVLSERIDLPDDDEEDDIEDEELTDEPIEEEGDNC